MNLVQLDDIRRASETISGVAVRTPLLPCPWALGLWLKPENLQPVGAFKIRGAYHAMACLDATDRARGVVTHSSGNHGRAVAYAAAAFGVPAVVVMPDSAPPGKIASVAALGAEIVLVPPARRLDAMTEIAQARGASVIPPFDDPHVIAGQGTVGLEILQDMPDVATILVPVGGGGLASGVATAAKAIRPDVTVIGVEPELAAEARESLHSGVLTPWPVADTYRTIADGLRTGPSELTFAHLRAYADDIMTVSEDQIRAMTGMLARESNIVAEPSGALGAALFHFRRAELPPGPVVAVVTGGNLEPALLAELLTV